MRGGKSLRVNACAGVAGDMFVGALLDLGLPIETLQSGLALLEVEGLEVGLERVNRSGIAAGKYRVSGPEGGPGHKRWGDIEGVITRAGLPPEVRDDSLRVFRFLFEAEARVHGSTPEEVHLHEAGGWDALADVVGACIGLDALEVGRIECGPVNVGSGLVSTSHGRYPVPAPATAECLRGAELFSAGPEGENATPTGAAILAALGRFTPAERSAGFVLERVGYGAGDRDPKGFANVLQVFLGSEHLAAGLETDLVLLEANLDDCDPRLLGALQAQLLEAGALDAWHTPIQMKKGRPAVQISALVRETEVAGARDLIFSEATTLGVRAGRLDRWVLDRTWEEVETPWGTVRVKVGRQEDRVRTAQPEFEDCRQLARRHGVAVKRVIRHALAAWTKDSEEG